MKEGYLQYLLINSKLETRHYIPMSINAFQHHFCVNYALYHAKPFKITSTPAPGGGPE